MTLDILARMGGGQDLPIRATIAAPEPQADGSAICRLTIAPLEKQPLDVRGVDSFHAVWLACGLVLKLLTHLRSAGAELRAADGSAFPLDAYLAGLDEGAKKSG
ncbi:MAG TPA: hypothetical protein VFI86_07120 [Burkholderiales bacterium]|nr:hypothetical protein [Burkholderiales bacterium]